MEVISPVRRNHYTTTKSSVTLHADSLISGLQLFTYSIENSAHKATLRLYSQYDKKPGGV